MALRLAPKWAWGGRKKKTDAARCTSEFELGWPKNYRVSFGFDYWLGLSPDEGGE